MIEVYAFLAMFAVQILAMSVLFPARLIRYSREVTTDISAERLAQLYPGLDHELATKRFLNRIRAGSTGVAVIGLLALGWLFSYMRQPDWSLGTVIALNTVYFLLQFLPLLLTAWFTYRLYKTHEHSSSEGKRTAMLERRGLFDYVSPTIVFVAVLAYILFVAFVLYVRRETFPALFLIGILTLVYALQAFDVYQRSIRQEARAARHAHGSRAQDRFWREARRLCLHRQLRVLRVHGRDRPAGSEEMGSVRCECAFRVHHTSHLHGHDCTDSPISGGQARPQRGFLNEVPS